MSHQRLVIYPKDIMIITGKSERHCRHLIKRMKDHFQKENHQYITIEELASFLGIDPAAIKNVIH